MTSESTPTEPVLELDHTHDPEARSWVEEAQDPGTDFPIQNLPFGTFREPGSPRSSIGVAIGAAVLDLRATAAQGFLDETSAEEACRAPTLNAVMALPAEARLALRHRLFALLSERESLDRIRRLRGCLRPLESVDLLVPAVVGDFTDFYASIDHASNVGALFRPENPLLPNYHWVPIAYHGRASSVVPNGTPVRRPLGQLPPEAEGEPPRFGPSERLDFELEVGAFVAGGNNFGEPIPIEEAEERIFGLCLVNDWSARDIQAWEYQPLGPFLGKSFATTVSPWVVTREALAPFRVPAVERDPDAPPPLPYLSGERDQEAGSFAVRLEVGIRTRAMWEEGEPPETIAWGTLDELYWTFAQMITHHTSNGCNLRPGDLIASGTVSGQDPESLGCLLERTRAGEEPITLRNGEERGFLEDWDEIVLRGWCEMEGFRAIGFGECSGRLRSPIDLE